MLAGVGVLLALAFAGAAVVLQGERLGRLVTGRLGLLAGKLEVRAISWSPRVLLDLVTDRPTRLELDGVRLFDPEGTLVLNIPHLSARIPPRSALGLKVRVTDMTVSAGSFWRFAEMKSGSIGFTAALKVKDEPPPPPDAPPSAFRLELEPARLLGLTAQFDFPGAWALELRACRAQASVVMDGDFLGWAVKGLRADGGYLGILDNERLPFDVVEVAEVSTTREWANDIHLDITGARTGRSTLRARGVFTHIYDDAPPGIEMRGVFEEAGDALTALAARHVDGLTLSGTGARLELHLFDSFKRLHIDGQLSRLDARWGDRRALGISTRLRFVAGPVLEAHADDLTFAAPEGGRARFQLSLRGDEARVQARFERLAVAGYLPPSLRRSAGGTLEGRFDASGNLTRRRLTLHVPQLRLSRESNQPGLPRWVSMAGDAHASPEAVSTEALTIDVPGASARLEGRIELARRLFSLALRLAANDLPTLLPQLGAPPLARAADVTLQAGGALDDPRVDGRALVREVGLRSDAPTRRLPELEARFGFRRGTAELRSLRGPAFGGMLSAQGTATLFRGTLSHPLAEPRFAVELHGRQLSLAQMLGLSFLSGDISFDAKATGRPKALDAQVTLPSGTTLLVYGQRFRLDEVDLALTGDRVTLKPLRIARAEGGAAELAGVYDLRTSDVDATVAVAGVPLSALPEVPALAPLGGSANLQLHVTGNSSNPAIDGELQLRQVKARGLVLGDARVVFTAAPGGGVLANGELFGRFRLAAQTALTPRGPRVHAALSFDRLAIEGLVPELARAAGGHGVLTGTVTADLQPEQPLAVDVRLSELAVHIGRPTSEAGVRARDVSIRNQSDIHATLLGERIHLDPATLASDGGELQVSGDLAGDAVTADARGHLDLELLQPFLASTLSRISGDLTLGVHVDGTRQRPLLRGEISVTAPVHLRAHALDQDITIPSGVIRLDGQSVALSRVVIAMDESRLNIDGSAQLATDFTPRALALDLRGDISARLLAVAAPASVSDAEGRISVEGHLRGDPSRVDARAELKLHDVGLRLRDVAGDIAITEGTVRLEDKTLTVRDLRATIDDQGSIRMGTPGEEPGQVVFSALLPKPVITYVNLPLTGERLHYRVPSVAEIDDLGFALTLAGDPNTGFGVSGDVRVVSGRYVQDFNVQDLVISPRIQESPVHPFYENNPLLENLALDFRVRTVGDSFYVRNNLAPEIHMLMELRVGGTLSEPTIAGTVRPTDGRFRLLGLRGDFDLVSNVNYITFVETKSLERGETPEVNFEAQSLVTDNAGVDHTVSMRISGPINQMRIDLSTDRGLDRNQTLLLLLSGQGSTDFARLGTTGNATIGANVQSSTAFIGQVTRDTVSNLVEPYIDDTLKLLTGDKVNLRPTIGADGFEVRATARPSRRFRLQLSYLRGFQSQRRWNADGNLWLADYLSLRSFWQQLTLQPQQGITEQFNSLNLELSVDYPIRWPMP